MRRVPQDTLRAMIFTKKGDKLDDDSIHRDFMALWNTGRFDDIRVEREAGKTGWILRFVMAERRVIRSIKYDGNKSVTNSEILDRFKERKVGLTVESQYDPNKIQRARNVLKDYLARTRPAVCHGRDRAAPGSAFVARSDFQSGRGPQRSKSATSTFTGMKYSTI